MKTIEACDNDAGKCQWSTAIFNGEIKNSFASLPNDSNEILFYLDNCASNILFLLSLTLCRSFFAFKVGDFILGIREFQQCLTSCSTPLLFYSHQCQCDRNVCSVWVRKSVDTVEMQTCGFLRGKQYDNTGTLMFDGERKNADVDSQSLLTLSRCDLLA